MIATGSFEIKMIPLETHQKHPENLKLKRLGFEKVFLGDMVGKSIGEMLNLRSATEGSAGYVALETLEVKLEGKLGSFAMQHFGTMQKGDSFLRVDIIPDSGTGELSTIAGQLTIDIVEGQHNYTLNYTL